MSDKPLFQFKFGDHKLVDSTVYYKATATCLSNGRTLAFEWRYSQLLSMHEQLEAVFSKMPTFPAKKWIGNTNDLFIAKRKA